MQAFPWLERALRRQGLYGSDASGDAASLSESPYAQPISVDGQTSERALREIVGFIWNNMLASPLGMLFPYVPADATVAVQRPDPSLFDTEPTDELLLFDDASETTVDELVDVARLLDRPLDVILFSLAQHNANSALLAFRPSVGSDHDNTIVPGLDREVETTSTSRVRNAFDIDAEIDKDRLDEGINPAFDIIEEFIYEFDERDWRILVARRLTKPAVTLDAVGAEFNLTRERIRQLEAIINRTIADWFANEPTIQEHSRRIIGYTKRLARLADVLKRFPSLTEPIDDTELPTWFVFDEFDDGFESDGVWVAVPSLASIREQIREFFEENSLDPGYMKREDFLRAVSDDGEEAERLLEFAFQSGYIRLSDLVLAPYATALQNQAACVLDARGVAMSVEEIYETLDTDRSIRSLSNALATDARFVRSGISAWSLASWGANEYVSISEEIRKILDEHGEASLEYVTDQISTQFGVARTSVAAYAGAHPYEIVNGFVRLTSGPAEANVRPLHKVRRVYRLPDGGVAFRLTATRDHLRGSGSVIPKHVATLRGIAPGSSEILVTNAGQQVRIAWTQPQPTLSTVRAMLQEIGVGVGEDFVVELRGGLALFSRVGPASGDPLADIRTLIGRSLEPGLTLRDLSEAVDLELLTWDQARAVFENRREPEVAILIGDVGRGGAEFLATTDVAVEVSRYEFSVLDPEPEALTFACVAASLEEAEGKARKAGFSSVLLLEVRPLQNEELSAYARREIIENPFLGPAWLPLVEALADSVSELRVGQFWALNVMHPLYQMDASEAPYIQAIQEADGSLVAELGSPQLLETLDGHALSMLELMGWEPPTIEDPINYRRIFEPGWNIRHVAYVALQTLVVGFGIDTRALFVPDGEAADGFDKPRRLDRLSQEDGRMGFGEAYGLKGLHVLWSDPAEA